MLLFKLCIPTTDIICPDLDYMGVARYATGFNAYGDNIFEHQAVKVDVDWAQLLVCNIYVPPVSSCPHGYKPNFASLFSHFDDILIMADFNAHDDTWFSSTQDVGTVNRGEIIVGAFANSQLMTINHES